MEDVTRKRILRKLESLPDEQLYRVLDYIEFIEAKYAEGARNPPTPFQRFAERVEDQMRVRSLAPRAMKGTMRLMSGAGRVLQGFRDLGSDLVNPRPAASKRPIPPGEAKKRAEASGAGESDASPGGPDASGEG